MDVDTTNLEPMESSGASTPPTRRYDGAATPPSGDANHSTSSSGTHWEPNTVSIDLQYEVSRAGLGAVPLGRSLAEISHYSQAKISKRKNLLDGFEWLQRFSFAAKDGGLPIIRVEMDGPGARAGLRACDVIIAVNAEDVRTLSAKQTAAVIKRQEKTGPSVDLTVIRCLNLPYDPETVSMFADPEHKSDHYRLAITIRQSADGMGFTPLKYSLSEQKTVPRAQKALVKSISKMVSFASAAGGLPVQSVDQGSPAEIAGLQPWDVVVAVNGTNITDRTCQEAVEIMRAAPSQELVELTVLRSVTPILAEDVLDHTGQDKSPKQPSNPLKRAIAGLHRLTGRDGTNSKVKQGQRADTWEDMVVTADIVDGVRAV